LAPIIGQSIIGAPLVCNVHILSTAVESCVFVLLVCLLTLYANECPLRDISFFLCNLVHVCLFWPNSNKEIVSYFLCTNEKMLLTCSAWT